MRNKYNERDTAIYRAFLKKVFVRDGHRCVLCRSKKRLNAHHLNAWHWYFNGRFDPKNAITLCGSKEGCHNSFHKIYGKINNTRYQFEQFILAKYKIPLQDIQHTHIEYIQTHPIYKKKKKRKSPKAIKSPKSSPKLYKPPKSSLKTYKPPKLSAKFPKRPKRPKR